MIINRKDTPIIIWLLTGCLLIFFMVVIGGITRLTNSGLSMVDWKLFMGIIPPLNEQEWIQTFEKYKQFPEYQQVNFAFSLADFKAIFFWEYLHRLFGRLIGMVFIIPFVYFLIKKKLSSKLIRQLIIILAMGAFQGFLGWWMVKSGLVKNPDVSHYRLAVHLITAFLTFAYTFWVVLNLIYREESLSKDMKKIRQLLYVFLGIVILQIIYGAFVAGLNAGFVMNTWPKMNGEWVHSSVTALNPLIKNFIDGIGGVQFVHRSIGIMIVILIIYLLIISVKYPINSIQQKSLIGLVIMVFIQFLLGVFTLLFSVPLILGALHQIGAFLLLGTVVFALFQHRKPVKVN